MLCINEENDVLWLLFMSKLFFYSLQKDCQDQNVLEPFFFYVYEYNQ